MRGRGSSSLPSVLTPKFRAIPSSEQMQIWIFRIICHWSTPIFACDACWHCWRNPNTVDDRRTSYIWKLHFVGGTKFSDPIGEFRARGKIKKLSPSHRKIRAPYRILMPSSERTLIARQTFQYPPHIISLTELQIYATQFVDILLLAAYVLPTKALVMLINNK